MSDKDLFTLRAKNSRNRTAEARLFGKPSPRKEYVAP
jgi:hypothetical protein